MLSIAASSPVSLLVGAKGPSMTRVAAQMNQADSTCNWATEPYGNQAAHTKDTEFWQRAAHDGGSTSYDCRGNVQVLLDGSQVAPAYGASSGGTPADVTCNWATAPYGNQAARTKDTEFWQRAAHDGGSTSYDCRGNVQVLVDGSQVAPAYGASSGGTPADLTCGWATGPYGRQDTKDTPFHQRATLDGTVSGTCVGNVQLQDAVPTVGPAHQMVGAVVPTRGMGPPQVTEQQAKQAWLAAR